MKKTREKEQGLQHLFATSINKDNEATIRFLKYLFILQAYP